MSGTCAGTQHRQRRESICVTLAQHWLSCPHQIFAVSIDKQILGGHAWWIFMTVVSTISAVVGMLVTEKPSATELHEAEEAGLMSELDGPDAHELK